MVTQETLDKFEQSDFRELVDAALDGGQIFYNGKGQKVVFLASVKDKDMNLNFKLAHVYETEKTKSMQTVNIPLDLYWGAKSFADKGSEMDVLFLKKSDALKYKMHYEQKKINELRKQVNLALASEEYEKTGVFSIPK